MKAIIRNNQVVLSPRNWDNTVFAKEFQKLGYMVSFPNAEPSGVLTFGVYKLVPVEEEKPAIDSNTEEYTSPAATVVGNKVVLVYGKQAKTPTPEPQMTNEQLAEIVERKKLENKYLEVTKQIMRLAGQTVGDDEWPKLEDTDYETIGLQACVNNPAVGSFLLTTLAYVHRTLKTDYNWQWIDIEYRPEVV